MPLANDDIRFVSDCSTPAFHFLSFKGSRAASDNRLPACFPFFKVWTQPYTVSSSTLVGEMGADPITPEDNGFMVLETRIELEIYAFGNLDCLLSVQFVK